MKVRETFRNKNGKLFFGYEVVNEDNNIQCSLYLMEITKKNNSHILKILVDDNKVICPSFFKSKREACKRIITLMETSKILRRMTLNYINNNYDKIIMESKMNKDVQDGMREIIESLHNHNNEGGFTL